jgi:hypothetical protein
MAQLLLWKCTSKAVVVRILFCRANKTGKASERGTSSATGALQRAMPDAWLSSQDRGDGGFFDRLSRLMEYVCAEEARRQGQL